MPLPATAAAYFRDGADAAVFSDPSLLALLKETGVATPTMPLSHLQPPPPWATVRCLPQMTKEPTPTEDGQCIQPLVSLPVEGVEVSMAEVAAMGGGTVPRVPSALHHRRYRVFPLGPICGVTDAATIQPCEDLIPALPQTSEPSYVVVDGPCAEAVLRGSNIYTPGIWCLVDSQRRTATSGTADSGLWAGATVVILVPKHGTVAPLKGSVLRRQVEKVSAAAECSSAVEGEEVDASSKTTFKPEDYIAVGRGLWTVSWRELISKQQDLNQGKKRVRDAPPTTPSTPLQGDAAVFADLAARNIAIVNTDTFTGSDVIGPVSMPPPPASEWYGSIGEIAIRKAHASRGEDETLPRLQPLVFMAQNVSSMLPAVLLAAGIDEEKYSKDSPAMLLDACAAPGGKTSHLLGQLFTRRVGSNWFKLQACDRSGSRAKSMQKLLQGQFPPTLLQDSLKVHCGKDVGSLLKETSTETSTTQDNSASSLLFDGIILDPPCTCLGLRPRLSPHTHGAEAIRASADYQRLLLTRCLSQLKPGGRLVYSTCTISVEENEDTILWALANMADKDYTGPKAHLVKANTVNEMQFCKSALGKLAKEQVLKRDSICGIEEDANAPLMVFRFMPNPSDSQHVGDQLADGVGFFVAVFERSL